MPYSLLADAVLTIHLLVVVFVVGGLVLIVAGNLAGWRWVDSLWFRGAHVAAIGFVVVESWLGATCPLTTLEAWLRVRGGGAAHEGDFVAYWIGRVLFYEAEPWVFTLVYTAFGALVAATWWIFPPRRHRVKRTDGSPSR